ncbi:hypothetical protein MA04_01447 [Alcanivorax balearicus MACL04]|uniref:DUF3613 domain-containing protein n=1 Tax=Alloalcanivorax balearicus MACL04 TaxID=1177182 RepID=A0ABT2QXB5_9GAMM|nr:hypothetical protein [Alloalcanivorax balearicus]MCU5782147.1 hypothetical protein [Alloalcanivorax balearicus MACL04]
MNKWMLITLTCLASTGAVAQEKSYEFGLSDSISNPKHETVTDWLLEQQRKSPLSQQSELPAQLYVDSQRRIGDTFKAKIPESLQEKASSMKRNSN